jgi:hypothetical protein
MPFDLAKHPCRSGLAVIAAWLVVLQSFLAGVATAQAGTLLAGDPVICHGTGGGSSQPAIPDAERTLHLCCVYCSSAGPPALTGGALTPANLEPSSDWRSIAVPGFTIILQPRIVRAGTSQAPPNGI